jgi:hypothetical protein
MHKIHLKRVFLCLLVFLSFRIASYPNPVASIDQNHDFLYQISASDISANSVIVDNSSALKSIFSDKLRLTDQLNASDVNQLPVGISLSIGNISYTVAFYKATFINNNTLLSAALEITIPDENNESRKLYFAADNIEYTPSGGISNAKLMLISTPEFNLGKCITLKINGENNTENNFTSNTYATIDCNGFKKLNISGDVILSREVAIPVDNSGVALPSGQISIPVQLEATDWEKIILSVSVPPFASPKLPDFIFKVKNAVIDFSEEDNSPVFSSPQGYETYLGPSPNAWKGLYVGDFSIMFPNAFKKSDKPLELDCKQLIIDNNGLTVFSSVKGDLLTLGEGNASGWSFSVNEFDLKLLASQLNGVGFGGQILLPVSESTPLDYTASLSGTDWIMSVSSIDTIDFNIWKARCKLEKNSTVSLKLKDGKFLPEALLNGSISINTSLVHFNGLTFEGLLLKTEPSYISIRSMGYTGKNIKLALLPITVSKINVTAENNYARLACTLAVNLDDLCGFTSSGNIQFSGKLDQSGGKQKWKFDKFSVSGIRIDGDFGKKVSLSGTINIRENDPIYGNGFAGDINMKILNKFDVLSHAVFGQKEDTRYWAVDGTVTGIKIPMAGFTITGFGGGISKHMAQQSGQSQSMASGLSYIPDKTKGLGLMASTTFTVPTNKTPVDGDAGFSILFGASGGLERLGFFGNAKVCSNVTMADPTAGLKSKLNGIVDKLNMDYEKAMNNLRERTWLEYKEAAYPEKIEQKADSKIFGSVGIGYDFTNNVLDGNMEVYIDAGPLLHGIGENNKAGWAQMHFDLNSGSWYIYIGEPSSRIGLETSIAGIKISTNSYFDIGTQLPIFPEPPKKVIDILNQRGTTYTRCPMDEAATGGGIAFGAGFDFKTGDLTFLVLYANFEMGAGFDVMLKNYGNDAHCEGETNPVGLNGWYARGQAYAYLTGDLGIRLKVFGIKKRFSIIKGSTAALLEAGLPNPTWFKGALAGEYSLMGNAIKGHFNFKFKIGDACKIEGASDPFETMQVIADMSPASNSTDISVFALPQVVFNVKMGEPVTVDGLDDGTSEQAPQSKTYRFSLTNLQVKKDSEVIDGAQKWNTNSDVVVLDRAAILPENSDLEFIAELKCEEKINGVWKDYAENGKVVTEQKTVKFKTGAAPNYISWENVAYMYPIKDQQRYYIDENHTGYVKLKMSQGNILPAPAGWATNVIINSNSGWQKTTSLSLGDGNTLLSFDVSGVTKSSIDSIKIINIPPAMNLEGNVSSVEETKNVDNTGNDVAYSTKKTSGTLTGNKKTKLLNFGFATSAFGTFAAKIDNISNKKVNAMDSRETSAFICYFSYMEPFDRFEIQSNTIANYTQTPLIQPSIVLDDSYFINTIKPKIYDNITGSLQLSRGTLNNPPTNGVYAWQSYFISSEIGKYLPFIYDNPSKYYDDKLELINKALSSNLQSEIKTGGFPSPLVTNNYKMRLQYIFPDGSTGTSRDFIFHTTY